MNRTSHQALRLSAISAAMSAALLAGTATAATLPADLNRKLAASKPTDLVTVVVTFKQRGPVNATQIAGLQAIGINRGVTMRSLPIMGVSATPASIRLLAQRGDVHSVTLNKKLRFFNNEANQSSGSRIVNERPGDFGRAIPFSGRGVTVAVIDSGVDATNLDLPLGTKLVDNVMAVPAAGLALADSILGPGIVPVVFLQNQQNTDLSSGHGTHVAGTVGGTGQQSKGKHRGAAPGADILGYGTGAAISILNAVVGLDYAATNQFSYRNPIRVTSNSWGTSADAFVDGQEYCDQAINVASYELAKKGIVTVFAAGNDGSADNTHNPYARAPWVISVGAGEKDGVLTSFSSRGVRGAQFDCKMHDGQTVTFRNEPTIVASGVNIVSNRAYTGALPLLGAQDDAAMLTPAELPFYTLSSGTSMATPHVSGVIALMLEANPDLSPARVKEVIQKTATNMTGRSRHEVGAGHLNAYAAVALAQAMAKGSSVAYGSTVNTMSFGPNATVSDKTYNASQSLKSGLSEDVTLSYAPAGAVQVKEFDVAADVLQIEARLNGIGVGVELVDPKGVVYGSSIALPVLGETVIASAPGMVGKWKLRLKGLRSYGGTQVAPPDSNGIGVPGSYTVKLSRTLNGGYDGLNDIAPHPARNAIEYAVGKRLADSDTGGLFRPGEDLKRGEFAKFLVMAGSLRQSLPFNAKASTSGLSATQDPALFAAAEIVTTKGSVLRDLTHSQAPVLPLQANGFNAAGTVSRWDLAYALVQMLALQPQAAAFTGEPTFTYEGKTLPVEIVGLNATTLQKGYIHLALNLGLVRPTLALKDSTTFGGLPTLVARFEAGTVMKRADYAAAIGQFQALYQAGEDAK